MIRLLIVLIIVQLKILETKGEKSDLRERRIEYILYDVLYFILVLIVVS